VLSGVPDKRMGEEICACIRVKEGMSVSEQELKDFCKGEVSVFLILSLITVFPMPLPSMLGRLVLLTMYSGQSEVILLPVC